MNPASKEFLLKEYEYVWKHSQTIWELRNKSLVFYFGVLGAFAAAGLGLIESQLGEAHMPGSDLVGAHMLGALMCLPAYFVLIGTIFVLSASMVMILLNIRLHTLAAEYLTVLNRIRAAFLRDDPSIAQDVVLATGQKPSKVWGNNFWILMITVLLSALVAGFGVAFAMNSWPLTAFVSPRLHEWRVFNQELLRAAPLLFILGWTAFWFWRYKRACSNFDGEMQKRLAMWQSDMAAGPGSRPANPQ